MLTRKSLRPGNAMRRVLIPLLGVLAAVCLPDAAGAAVLSSVSSGTLTITGDAANDQITLRVAPGAPRSLQVVTGTGTSTFDRMAFTDISIRSGGGADDVRMDESGGVFTDTEPVTIETAAGADTISGGAGGEIIAAGDDADFVGPGGGDDTILLGAGDDTALQGDGFDQVDGQAGTDRLRAVGGSASEEFTLQAAGTKARIFRDTGPAATDAAAVEALDVRAGGGPDLVDIGDLAASDVATVDADLGVFDGARDELAAQGSDIADFIRARPAGEVTLVTGLPGLESLHVENSRPADDRLTLFGRGGPDDVDAFSAVAPLIGLTVDGGPGGDLIAGTDGPDLLRGGPDADVIRGRKADDTVDLGDGDDVFLHQAPDGADLVDGGAGQDTGSAGGTENDDTIEVGPSGARTRVFGASSGSLELDRTEQIMVDPKAGTDNVIVRDLTGTPTTEVTGALSYPDQRTDTLTAIGSTGPETIKATTSGAIHSVTGLAATVRLASPETGTKLAIDAGDGDDTVDAQGITKDKLQPIMTGGGGKDFIRGTEGQDTVAGGIGADVTYLGGGLDTFKWVPGDGSDIVDGQSGTDFLQMDGSAGNERFEVTPIGGRTWVTRDLDAIRMDLGGVERLDILPGIGGDIVRVADMSGTDTDNVFVNLALARTTTATDQTIDRVFVDGSNGTDAVDVTAAGPHVRVDGVPAVVTTAFPDPALDRLHVDTKLGNDTINVAPNVFQLIGFTWSQ